MVGTFKILILFLSLFGACFANLKRSLTLGAYPSTYEPTKGEPWPKPQLVTRYGQLFVVVRPSVFRFETVRNSCDLVEDALKRYYAIINRQHSNYLRLWSRNKTAEDEKPWKGKPNYSGYLDLLTVDLQGPCEEYPHENMDESYELKIDTPDLVAQGVLTAVSGQNDACQNDAFSKNFKVQIFR